MNNNISDFSLAHSGVTLAWHGIRAQVPVPKIVVTPVLRAAQSWALLWHWFSASTWPARDCTLFFINVCLTLSTLLLSAHESMNVSVMFLRAPLRVSDENDWPSHRLVLMVLSFFFITRCYIVKLFKLPLCTDV